MKLQIIEKINKQIGKGVEEESDVFYIIGQSRKYLESIYPKKKDRESKYPTLSLIEDWILHPKLQRAGAEKKLEEYADFFEENKEDATTKFMTEFALFSDLRSDLKSFCISNNINTVFLDDDGEWCKFLELLIEILKDLPLEGDGAVKSFAFSEGLIVDDTKTVTFSIAFSDGRRGSYTVDLEIYAYEMNRQKDKIEALKTT